MYINLFYVLLHRKGERASIWISISHNLHHMDQQNIYLPCSCKGLMKIKSSFNWYCSLNELGWQNVYRERWIKTRAIDELRAQRTDECHTCLIAMIAQLYKIILYYSYTRIHTHVCTRSRFASITIPILIYVHIICSIIIQHSHYYFIGMK